MEDYSKSVDLYKGSVDSAGIANKKMDFYMQGNEASLNRLKNAMQGIWDGMMNSNELRGVVDGITSFTNGISGIVKSVGSLPVVLGVATASFLLFNNGLEKTITNGKVMGSIMGNALKALVVDTETFNVKQSLMAIGATSGATTIKLLSGSFAVLGTVVKSTMAFIAGAILPVAAFMALGWAIQKVTEAYNTEVEASQKMQQQNQDISKTYATNSQEIDKLVASYTDLSNKKSQGKLSVDEDKQYLDVQNQLNKIMPVLTTNVDQQGQAHLRSADSIQTEIKYAQQLSTAYKTEYLANFNDEIDKTVAKLNDLKKKADDMRNQKVDYVNGIVATDGQNATSERMAVEYDREAILQQQALADSAVKRVQAFNDVNQVTKKLSQTDQDYINKQIQAKQETLKTSDDTMVLSGRYIDLSSSVAKINDALKTNYTVQFFDEMFKGTGITKDQTQAIIDNSNALNNGVANHQQVAQALENAGIKGDTLSKVMNLLNNNMNANTNATNANSNANNNNGQSSQNASNSTNVFTQALEANSNAKKTDISMSNLMYGATTDLITEIQQNARVVEVLTGVQGLNQQQTDLLAQAKQFLAGVFPQLNGQIDNHMNWINAEVKAYQIVNDATASVADVHLANEYIKTQSTITNTSNRIEAYKREINALNSIAEASIGVRGDNYTGHIYNGIDTITSDMNGLQGQLDQAKRQANDYANQINNLKPGSASSGGSSGTSAAQKAADQAAKDAQQAAQQAAQNQEQFVQDIVNLYKEGDTKQKDIALASIETQRVAYQKLHDDRIKLIDDETKKYEDAINKQLAALDKQNAANDYSKNLKKEQDKRQEIVSQMNSLALDTSNTGKAKMADLTKQLQQQDDAIATLQTDRSRSLQKDDLNASVKQKQDAAAVAKAQSDAENVANMANFDKQKASVTRDFDNRINDNRKFAKVRDAVGNRDTGWIMNDLAGISNNIRNNLSIVGESVGQNFIDLTNKAHNQLWWQDYQSINPKGFATGGYTGSFGSSDGKLALLHEKEIVLNQTDTKNILSVVDIVRSMVGKIQIPTFGNMPTLSPSPSGGTIVHMGGFHIDKLIGNESGAKDFFGTIAKEMAQRGITMKSNK